MSNVRKDRHVEGDWWMHPIPANVEFGEGFYCETAQIFRHLRSKKSGAVVFGNHVSCYAGCSFSIGKNGQCAVGDFTLLNGALVMAEEKIEIGSHCLISWNVVLMDTYRVPFNAWERRRELERVPTREPRLTAADVPARPIHVERNVWIGFDACVLPGVTIGEGSVVGTRSVVFEDVPPYTVVAGNPARVIRRLEPGVRATST